MQSLIRTRINQNLLTVRRESKNVKSLLSLANQLAKSTALKNNQSEYIKGNIQYIVDRTKRKDLLHILLFLSTSRNIQAQKLLLPFIKKRLGKIHDADFEVFVIYLSNKPYEISNPINHWLCENFDSYSKLFDKYFNLYYAR